MYIGQVSYIVFQYFGMWRPLTWSSQWRIWIYRLYSAFMMTIYSIFTFSILIHLLRDTADMVNNMETLFQFVSAFAIWVKIITIMVKRKTIIDAKDILVNKLCHPRDLYELEILQNCSKVCRSNTIILLLLTSTCALMILMTPLSKKSKFPLPCKIWIPYSLESRFAYSLTYFHQGVVLTMAAIVTASIEGLAMVIMLQICAELDIIVHRLHLLPRLEKENDSESIIFQCESRLVKDCIAHHIDTYILGEKLNESFGPIIFVQFFASMMGLCAVIYSLSKLNINDSSSLRLIVILLTALVQIFIYCFYGDKLMEQSMSIAEQVYQIDWVETTTKTKKNLTSIMIRAGKPIKLTGLSMIIMTIDTFVKIVKSAYSGSNLLKST